MATEFKEIESRLWKVADTLRANSGLKASEYSTPVLALIFLKYAGQRFREAQTRLETQYPGETFTRDDFQAEGVLYLRESTRYGTLLHLPESRIHHLPAQRAVLGLSALLFAPGIDAHGPCSRYGATFKEISRSNFRTIPVVLPPTDLSCMFEDSVSSVWKLLEVLGKENKILRGTRACHRVSSCKAGSTVGSP